ncbi:MAG: hypothetical protein LBD59_04050, partial [Prevotellaceae bacterium]|nr:hypothetical protein [Prevotellaceae bacterium]
MFDNIKLCLPYRFSDNAERERFCSRFGLLVKDEKKQIYNNKGYETLSQNKGVYIHLKNSRLTLEFSLHKFFNYCLYSKPLNYNDFNFKEAKQAAEWLDEMFKPYFDIMHSKVMKYEVGINVITSENPDLYLQELKQMNISVKILPIKEDIHYKEYKQFSTQRDSGKRIIYIFYNKTFEARSKTKNMQAKMNVPENVLRVEKDNKRPTEKIPFARLFDKDFISFTVNEFKTRFCENLEYRGNPQKPENMNKADFELLQLVYEKGRDGANSKIENDYKNGIIKRANYFNRLR